MKKLVTALSVSILFFICFAASTAEAQIQQVTPDIKVITATQFDVSPALRDIDPSEVMSIYTPPEGGEVPNKPTPVRFVTNRNLGLDPALQQVMGQMPTSAPLANFNGLGNQQNADLTIGPLSPPDPNIEVGNDYVVEMVNLVYGVYNKDGTLAMDPLPGNALWEGFGGPCETTNDGDPIVLYDQDADRWILTQFALPAGNEQQCVAVSTTSDPTGTFYRYAFPQPGFNDYPKQGVTPEAYTYTHNQFGAGYEGAVAGGFDREAMLAGDPDATQVLFGPDAARFSIMPADIDGPFSDDLPNIFAELTQDAITLYELDVDFDDPASSSFTEIAVLDVEPFDSQLCTAARGACIPQPSGPDLESLAGRLMHRLQFRDMGSYNAMVVSHTVDADGEGRAGVRWYEFRDEGDGWSVYQQGTYAPADGQNRFMPSIAMNAAGAIALGYSVSSETLNPAIRYTGRPPGAPLGEMSFEETSIIEGPVSQASSSRWGDYTSMVVDASDDATFWYVNQYGSETQPTPNWDTQIASFAFDTDDDLPPGVISDLSATAVGSNVELVWTAPADDAGDPGSGPVSRYEIRYSTDGAIADTADFNDATPVDGVPSPIEPGTEQAFVVETLDFETQYWFAIRAVDDNLNASLSNSPSATTGTAPILAYSPDSLTATLEPNQTTTQTLTLSNEGPGDSNLNFTFPAFAAEAILNQPGVQKNDTSRPLQSADHAKEQDRFAGAGNPIILGAGGPDNFGYEWIDSNEPGGPAFNWVDISEEGTAVSLSDDDAQTVPLPFPFEFYGEERSEISISSNGYLTFGGNGTDFSNDPIPTGADPNDLIAAFWDDLDPNSGGNVYYLNDEDNDRFIVQYDGVAGFGGLEGDYTFQVILGDDGTLLYQYLDMESSGDIESATVGVENADGSDGLQVAFNTAYVEDSLAVAIAAAPEFITDVSPFSGTLEGGSSEDIAVTFSSEDLPPALYEDELLLVTNDPDALTTNIPAELAVEAGPPEIAVEPQALDFGEVLVGNVGVQTFTIFNEGGGPLQVSNITTDNPVFMPSVTSDVVIDFGESLDVSVIFTPTEVGPVTGTLTVESNDDDEPSVEVTLEGEGVPPPVIAASPDSLSETLEVNETATDILTVSNEGESTLFFEAVFELGPDSTLSRADVAAPLSVPRPGGENADLLSSARPSGAASGPSGPLQPMDATYQIDDGTAENAIGLTGGGDVMWLNAFEVVEGAGTITSIYTAWGSEGGTGQPPSGAPATAYVYEDPNDDGDPADAVLLTSAETEVQDPGTNAFTTVPVTPTEVEGTFFIAVLYQNQTDGVFPAPLDESSEYQEASWVVGEGTPGNFNPEDLSSNSLPPDLLGNVGLPGNWLLRAEGGDASFVTVVPDSGSVAPGASQDLEVQYDATDANPGVYEGAVILTSNDPENPNLAVPTTLEVIFGDPEIAVDPSSLDFGDVFVGATDVLPLSIINTGNGPLEVEDLITDNPVFTVQPDSAFTVPLGDTTTVNVAFSPEAVQSYSGTLNIVSNALNEGTIEVPLTGEGLPAPVIAVEPDSLSETLQMGAMETRTLTFTNNGGSDLEITLSVGGNRPEVDFEPIDPSYPRGEYAPSTGAAPADGQAAAGAPSDVPRLDPVGVIGYGSNVPLSGSELVSFDLGEPGDVNVIAPGPGGAFNGAGTVGPDSSTVYHLVGTILWEQNTETGELTELGDVSPASGQDFSGLTYDAAEDAYYGTTTSITSSYLYEVDVEAVSSTEIGEIAAPAAIAVSAGPDGDVLYTYDITTDTFLSIDKETAATTEIGPIGFDANFGQGMEYDPETGMMYMGAFNAGTFLPELRAVNLETGGTTLIGALDVDQLGWIGAPAAGADFLTFEPTQLTIAPGASEEVEVTFDATDLDPGTYTTDIVAMSNDPETPVLEIPATLIVAPTLVVTPEPGPDSTRTVSAGEEFLVPITVTDIEGLEVQSYEFTLTFADILFVPVGVETEGTLSEGVTLAVNTEVPGQIRVAAADPSSDAPQPVLFALEGEGTLINVRLRARQNVGASSELRFTRFVFNEGDPEVVTQTTTYRVGALLGDATGDGEITAMDASQILRYAVGLIDLSEAQLAAADVSSDGDASAFDASLILQFVAGEIDCFPADDGCEVEDAPALATQSSGSSQSATLAWGTPEQAQPSAAAQTNAAGAGQPLFSVPLVLGGRGAAVRSVELSTDLDPSQISVEGVETSLPEDWLVAHRFADDGTLKIAMAGVTPLSAGQVATVQLRRLSAGAAAGQAPLELAGQTRLNEAAPVQMQAAELVALPEVFAVKGNYPNPFSGRTRIAVDLPESAEVSVRIYDVLGRRVLEITRELAAGAGRTVELDGARLAPGTYFYRVVAESGGETRTGDGRMTLVK